MVSHVLSITCKTMHVGSHDCGIVHVIYHMLSHDPYHIGKEHVHLLIG